MSEENVEVGLYKNRLTKASQLKDSGKTIEATEELASIMSFLDDKHSNFATIPEESPRGNTVFHIAAELNNVPALKCLYEKMKHNPNDFFDIYGNNPLYYAVKAGAIESIIYLKQIGIDIEHKNRYGKTVLDKIQAQKNRMTQKEIEEIRSAVLYGKTKEDLSIDRETLEKRYSQLSNASKEFALEKQRTCCQVS